MKNYSKLILFGSFFFCKLAVSIEPHELLSQFKAMAEEARTEEIARLKQMVLLPREHSVVFPDDFNRDDWRHGKYRTDYQNCLNSWYDRITIDHIRIIYVDFNGKRLVNYLQLVNSSSCSRYFYCNEDENEKLLKELIENRAIRRLQSVRASDLDQLGCLREALKVRHLLCSEAHPLSHNATKGERQVVFSDLDIVVPNTLRPFGRISRRPLGRTTQFCDPLE